MTINKLSEFHEYVVVCPTCIQYMIIGMHYHNQQVPIHYRVCGQRLTKYRTKKSISYECKAFSAELKIAFDIDTSWDDVNVYPEMFCMHYKLSMLCHHKGSASQMCSDTI